MPSERVYVDRQLVEPLVRRLPGLDQLGNVGMKGFDVDPEGLVPLGRVHVFILP